MNAFAILMGSFLLMAVLPDAAIAAEQAPEIGAHLSGCSPKPGEGARWLASCESAAKAGDGNAAIIAGKIYWNGDGVPKDNASAAIYWKMADQSGQPEAAKLLGDEAYVGTMRPSGACQVDPSALEEGVGWYRKAITVERNPALRQQAQERLAQFLKLKSMWPPACGDLDTKPS